MNGRTRASAVGALSIALVAGIAGAALAQDPAPNFDAQAGALTLVGYTTPREAYAEIIPLFQATEAGKDVQVDFTRPSQVASR